MLEVKPFSARDKRFKAMLDRTEDISAEAFREAGEAINAVRSDNGEGLVRSVNKADSPLIGVDTLRVSETEIRAARDAVSEQFLTALSLVRVNARKFHEYQRRRGYVHDDNDGVRLSRQASPLSRVGICCGDSFGALLMHAVPAQMAGVEQIAVAAAPSGDGSPDPRVLAAAKVLGIDEVYRMSGARAVAAFAFGAGPVERVDKVVGPGGESARAAKMLLANRVGVDGDRGRGELLIVADDGANAKFIASDLLAQAEFADSGLLVLATTDLMLAQAVRIEMDRLVELLPNAERIRKRLAASGAIYVFSGLYAALDAANALAPARLCLLTRDNQECLSEIRTAGAVFLGPWSTDVSGGYFSGANPFLPIGGCSAFATGLGVDDFIRETTVVEYGPERFLKTGRHMAIMAEEERLPAHAEAVRERLELLKLTVE